MNSESSNVGFSLLKSKTKKTLKLDFKTCRQMYPHYTFTLHIEPSQKVPNHLARSLQNSSELFKSSLLRQKSVCRQMQCELPNSIQSIPNDLNSKRILLWVREDKSVTGGQRSLLTAGGSAVGEAESLCFGLCFQSHL